MSHAPGLAVYRLHRPARDPRVRLYLMAQGGSRVGDSCTRGGYPPLVWMGIRTSNMDNRRNHRNGSAPQRSRRPWQYDRHRIHLHAQPVRQGARADQRGLLVVVKRNSERVFNDAKTAQDRNTEMTLMWNRWRSTLFTWYPNVIAIGPAGSWPWWSMRTIIFYGLSVVLWLFLRLLQAASIECAGALSQPRSWVGFS